jgi:hypothetical protein
LFYAAFIKTYRLFAKCKRFDSAKRILCYILTPDAKNNVHRERRGISRRRAKLMKSSRNIFRGFSWLSLTELSRIQRAIGAGSDTGNEIQKIKDELDKMAKGMGLTLGK